MTQEPRFSVGQEFTTCGKTPRLCKIVDILKTYNAAGEFVRLRYIAEHRFLGQRITEEVNETTVARGIIE